MIRREQAALALEQMADWSEWVPFHVAVVGAPQLPGAYIAKQGNDGAIIYVGMAGERAGGGRPQGLRGRLRVYSSGKAMTSGLGEAVADRAFADSEWLRDRVHQAERREAMRAVEWGKATFARAALHIRWAVTTDKASASALEKACRRTLTTAGLWNRSRF